MTETHITGAGHRETVRCGDRIYTLRPITFGEAARLAEAEAAVWQGGPAAANEAVRRALEAAGKPELVQLVDDHEDADLQLTAVAVARPHPQEPPEAMVEWRREWRQAQLALLRASQKRQAADALVAADPGVTAARKAVVQAEAQRKRALLALALVEPAGAEVDALPAADVETLYQRAQAMARPGVTEGKA